jgi:hypothetical protein
LVNGLLTSFGQVGLRFFGPQVAHISRFARDIGALEGEVRHDELVATQFAAL